MKIKNEIIAKSMNLNKKPEKNVSPKYSTCGI